MSQWHERLEVARAPRDDGLSIVRFPAAATDSLRAAVAPASWTGCWSCARAIPPTSSSRATGPGSPSSKPASPRHVRAAPLRSAGLTPERLAELPASGRPEISYESENGGGGASRRATLLMLFAVIYGIFVAAAYMFTRLYGKEPGWGEVRRWLRES